MTVAPWRQDRTYHPPTAHCPLCPTRPGAPETEIPEPDYHIAVFENRFPSFTGDLGRCEVVCYTSEHESSLGRQSEAQLEDLVEVWQERTAELSRLPGVKYVYVFENRGEEIGVTLSHPHGQIYAYPFIPPTIGRELRSTARYWRKTGRCLYCDIIAEERTGPRKIFELGGWIAFVPEFARWPYEVQLAPLAHRAGLTDLTAAESSSLAAGLREIVRRYDRLFDHPLAYVMAMHQRPPGRGHRQYHFHIEFYPPNRAADKLKYMAGSELGAGAFILDVRAEDSAARLRELG